MSEPVTKQRPTVDLDDFERRLHEQARPHDDDPLAELARLVGERHDPYGDVFAHEAVARPPAYQGQARHEPDSGQRLPLSPRLSGDFAAIEAGLRGAFSPEGPETGVPTYAHDAYHGGQHQGDAPHGYEQPQDYAPTADYDEAQWAQHERAVPPARKRRPVFVMAATIAVGVIGIGAAFALKGHGSSPGEIKTIMAAAGPTKIQPPADAPQDATSQDSSILGKTNQPAPTKLVNREEQPVDLAQTVEQNARAAPSGAANVPVPLSPAQQQDAINANPGASISDQGFNITPKKVKSISVRPDGTILPNDEPPVAAMPAPNPVRSADRNAPVARSSTPKSTSRVPTTPKPTQTADASDTSPQDLTPKAATTSRAVTTPKVVKKVKPPKPQRVATAETDNQDATQAAAPVAAPKADAGGGWAVQLAAPTSEAEARSVSSKLGSKFADALSGHSLAFHKAASNGKTVYRVRAGGMSKEDASSLCDKLKADGGSCFIAKN